MVCPQCSAPVPKDARFCPQCGCLLVSFQHDTDSPGHASRGWSRFFMSLGLSLGLTAMLTLVFHLPIFILGAFLPWFWISKKQG